VNRTQVEGFVGQMAQLRYRSEFCQLTARSMLTEMLRGLLYKILKSPYLTLHKCQGAGPLMAAR
jgi:hypothetical protein